MARWSLTVALLLAWFALPASAEVSDKIAPLRTVWWVGVVGGLGTAGAADRSILGGLASAAFFGLLSFVPISELHDPWVGPAIISEQGESYRLAAYTAPALVTTDWLVGAFSRQRRSRRQSVPR